MSKKKVKISKVEINIGDKTIELSLKEAEELREILNETFGKTTVINPSPTIIREPVYAPRYPNYWTVSNISSTTAVSKTSNGVLSNSSASETDSVLSITSKLGRQEKHNGR